MGFPTQVNVQPALGVAGDFCDSNPRVSVVNQAGAFVAGLLGCTVGLFAWAEPANNTRVNNYGVGAPTGFVHREEQALITQFLAQATQTVVPGLGITLFSSGGFWAKNDGSTAVTIGMKAYADNATGKVSFAATGTPTVGGTSTASTIAATTASASSLAVNSFTGSSFSGTTFTLGAAATGGAFVGQTLSGTNVLPGTTILAQLSGTLNGAGTYQVSTSQTLASLTVTGSGSILTVGGTVAGYFAVGETLGGSSVTAGSVILAQLSGTAGLAGTYAVSVAQTLASQAITATGGLMTIGGTVTGSFLPNDLVSLGASAGTYIKRILTGSGQAGTYLVNNGQTVSSTAINVNANTETKWLALSAALPGELVKLSTHTLG